MNDDFGAEWVQKAQSEEHQQDDDEVAQANLLLDSLTKEDDNVYKSAA
jgi:hypothetical protein